MSAAPTRRIVFLDSDHVLDVARNLLDAPGAAADAALRDFFAPEAIDIALLRGLGAAIRDAHAIEVERSEDPRDADVIVLRRGAVNRPLMERAPRLTLIQKLGPRTDAIDIDAAAERGIAVSCLPRRTLAYTAEHALLLMLALSKKLVVADAAVRAAATSPAESAAGGRVAYNWTGATSLGGLDGRTLGIVGMGEVGELVARLAGAFGMGILYTARSRMPEARETALSLAFRRLPDLLAESDFVSLHLRGTAENTHVIDAAAIGRMRPGAFLVNTARGNLVDEDALYAALAGGRIGGAGLDVHATEPRPAGDRFFKFRNVILTPHIAGGSRLGVIDEVKAIFENIEAALSGRHPRHGRVEMAAP